MTWRRSRHIGSKLTCSMIRYLLTLGSSQMQVRVRSCRVKSFFFIKAIHFCGKIKLAVVQASFGFGLELKFQIILLPLRIQSIKSKLLCQLLIMLSQVWTFLFNQKFSLLSTDKVNVIIRRNATRKQRIKTIRPFLEFSLVQLLPPGSSTVGTIMFKQGFDFD